MKFLLLIISACIAFFVINQIIHSIVNWLLRQKRRFQRIAIGCTISILIISYFSPELASRFFNNILFFLFENIIELWLKIGELIDLFTENIDYQP